MGKGFENYVGVAERNATFRSEHPKGGIVTSVEVSFEKEAAVIRASVINEDGTVLGTGHSVCTELGEEKGLEKAESIAVGRALNFAGYYADSTTGEESTEAEEAPAPRAAAPAVRRAVATTSAPAATPARTAAVTRPAAATTSATPSTTSSKINELRSQFGKAKTVAAPAPAAEEATEETSEEGSDENYDFAQGEAEVEATPTKTTRLVGLRR